MLIWEPVQRRLLVVGLLVIGVCAGCEYGNDFDRLEVGQTRMLIETEELSEGTIFSEYEERVNVTGAVGGCRWAVLSGGFPPGLTMREDGSTAVVSGLPTLAGSYSFALSVRDSAGHNATKQFAIDVSQPRLSVSSPSVVEGSDGVTKMTFVISLYPVVSVPVSVDYRTQDDSASTTGSDYISSQGSLIFPIGLARRHIDVAILSDLNYEPTETLALVLSNAGNAEIAGRGVGTIINDDLNTLFLNDAEITEEDEGQTPTMTFWLTLQHPSDQDRLVRYELEDGSARGGYDYVQSSGVVFIASGVRAAQVHVPIVGDSIVEETEDFYLLITEAEGIDLPHSRATGRIIDNGDLPLLDAESISVVEGQSGQHSVDVHVSLSNVETLTTPVLVSYSIADENATGGEDYLPVGGVYSGQLEFVTNTPQVISLLIYGDTNDEPSETILVSASVLNQTPANSVIGVVTIVSDDAPGFYCEGWDVLEGDDERVLMLSVSLSHYSMPDASYSVGYSISGSATPGEDYTLLVPSTGTIAFDDGVTLRHVIEVLVLGDRRLEFDEDVVLTLMDGGALNGMPIVSSVCAGIIRDDDRRAFSPLDTDFNDDGHPDIVVGAPGYFGSGARTGRAYVFFGNGESLQGLSAEQADVIITGPLADDQGLFGIRAHGIEDINADGVDDIAITQIDQGGEDDDAENWGAVYILFGGAHDFLPSIGAGMSGHPLHIDLSRGVPAADVYPHAVIYGLSDRDTLGSAVASIGNFNGDPYNDIVIGSPQNGLGDGKAYILYGSETTFSGSTFPLSFSIDDIANVTIEGEAGALSRFGAMATGVGDINGDGLHDIVVGAPAYDAVPAGDDDGKAYLFLGSESSPALIRASTEASAVISPEPLVHTMDGGLGISAAYLGDINEDGLDDFVVGAYRQDENPSDFYNGSAYLFFGRPSLRGGAVLTHDIKIRHTVGGAGVADKAELGFSLSGLGDFDGDGVNDFAIGAPRFDAPTGGPEDAVVTDRGEVLVFRGGLLNLELEMDEGGAFVRIQGLSNKDQLGHSVGSLGDIDGDGLGDLIVGAPQFFTSPGSSYVLTGRSFAPSTVLPVIYRSNQAQVVALTGTHAGEQFAYVHTGS